MIETTNIIKWNQTRTGIQLPTVRKATWVYPIVPWALSQRARARDSCSDLIDKWSLSPCQHPSPDLQKGVPHSVRGQTMFAEVWHAVLFPKASGPEKCSPAGFLLSFLWFEGWTFFSKSWWMTMSQIYEFLSLLFFCTIFIDFFESFKKQSDRLSMSLSDIIGNTVHSWSAILWLLLE